jgi:hypothetical protein
VSCYSKLFEFYPGESKRLSIQINKLNTATGCKEPLELEMDDEVEITIPASPSDIILSPTSSTAVHVQNRHLGKIYVDLTDVETQAMIDGPIVVEVTSSAGAKNIALVIGGVRRLSTELC